MSDFHTECAGDPNHGRGRCKKVTVVWKIDMAEGLKKFYCIAQNPEVAKGIRAQFADEARSVGIKPHHYVTYEDYPVVWSRTVFTERYRLMDTDTGEIIWASGHHKENTGEYSRRKGALDRANRMIKEGTLKNYVILRWNRRFRKWDISDSRGEKPRLPGVREFTKKYKGYL